jgi:Helix-turn-helix domain
MSIHEFPGADKLRQNGKSASVIIKEPALRAGFTEIPNTILRNPDLTPGAKLVFMGLMSYAWGKDSCFPGQERLAKDIGLHRVTVNKHIRELKEKGFLEVTRRGKTQTNLYILNCGSEVV